MDMRHITVNQILSETTVKQATEMFDQTSRIPTNGTEPWTGFIPPIGTWRYDKVLDEFSVLVEMDADDVIPSEKDWEFIKRHKTYRDYVKWAKAGHVAPPADVFRSNKGNLLSANRRRVLAAQEAETKILAWFSESDESGGRLWRLK